METVRQRNQLPLFLCFQASPPAPVVLIDLSNTETPTLLCLCIRTHVCSDSRTCAKSWHPPQQFATGLFDSPYIDESGVTGLNSAANQALALRAAEEGVVLLKNSRNVLPLTTGKALKIAVIGPNAHGSPDNLDSVRKNYLGS